ncbi:MAG TPA: NADH-ubiquinone oxidoreductase-F iron-sulfur binding region domain-containing protein [Acidimicrobiales bacterium]|nr:NADH-ubiquinone oxidoreductase-F iron-sulfur binding region domain-containing protein [Acidimicrobiales bacterium]
MTAVCERPTAGRLLAGLADPEGASGLAGHLRVHGPLPRPRGARRTALPELAALLAEAGLTGRGGAAFPAAKKLEAVGARRRRPVVVVNAMEGEPASKKDLVLATHAPHLVLDGAELLAEASHAAAVYVCVASDQPAAARAYERAIDERRRSGLSTATELRLPPGRYVAGEESALLHWLAGGEAVPTFRPPGRPPRPSVGPRPALVHNAETHAHVALVARHGPAWFRSLGTAEAPGTTLVTVSGAVARPGVLEVPLGTPVGEVLASAGGSPPPAVLLGGYGGTWLSGAHLDTPLAPAPLAERGATLGAGVVVALPDDGCGVAETARVARWMAGESAGQCGPCAFGLPAVADDLEQLAFGQRRDSGARLASRLEAIVGRGACRHPDGVVRLVRSALRVFADDMARHLDEGPCPSAHRASVLVLPARTEEASWR